MNKVLSILTKIETILASIFVLFLTIFVIVDVGAREIFSSGIPWTQKSAVYLMIWTGFLGAVLVTQKAEHLRPEIADKIWKGKGAKFYLHVQNLIILIFCVLMAYNSFLYVAESREFADRNIILDIPMWWLQMIIPYAFISMSLRYLYFTFCPPVKKEGSIH
jgi:TRAP-type C4-dicarboxylate transport system permease small subunit